MPTPPKPRTGGQLLADALVIHGADTVFCVPGESYLALLDALYDHGDRIKVVTCRHEGGAANMAEVYGKLTGRPGICMVTRGPGACHGSLGVHTARQNSSPMIFLVGQVARAHLGREAFQEIDYRRMFGQSAKWVEQVDDAARVPEMMHRAFTVATSGRPGPVVLALPEDMLREPAAADLPRYRPAALHPGREDMATLRARLAAAKRPMTMVGGGGWTARACRQIVAFAGANNLPTCCSFRRQDVFDNDHPNYAGDLGTGANPKLVARVREADLLIVVGARLGEITTQGYTLLEAAAGLELIHVHPDEGVLGRVYPPVLAIQATMPEFAEAAAALPPVDRPGWGGWTNAAREDYLETLEPAPYDGALDLGAVMRHLRETIPEDTIVALDAGNASGWPMRFLSYRQPGTQLGPQSGAMGYGVPAAVAAAIVHPGRLVLGFAGDGAFLMNAQELATAMRYGAAPVFLVFNNDMYGTIRMHQERDYVDREVGTGLTNPDFAALARAYGAHGETVGRTEEFAPAFERARAAGTAAVIELRMDPEVITTRTTLSAIRETARAR